MLVCGDARYIPIRSDSVQCVVTSPPYWGLRDYGMRGQIGLESSPDEYVSQIVSVFREVHRVLRKDGTVWLNLGDSYSGPKGNNRGEGAGGGSDRGILVWGNAIGGKAIAPGLKPKDL